MKTCNRCGETKPLDAFYRGRGYRDGYQAQCKSCRLAYHAARRRTDPTVRANEKQRTAAHLATDPDHYRHEHRHKSYGITAAAFRAKLAAQGGVCACCGQPETSVYHGRVRALAVDHDHVTGQIRDLLCYRCNMAAGRVEEDPMLLQQMIDYLTRHKTTLS